MDEAFVNNSLEGLKIIAHKHPIIFYDGVCILCSRFIQFSLKQDKEAKIKYCLLQNDKGEAIRASLGLPTNEISTVIAIYKDKVYTHSEVLRLVLQQLGGFWRTLLIIYVCPKPLRDKIYNFVANNRYRWFGKSDQCMIPSKEFADRFI